MNVQAQEHFSAHVIGRPILEAWVTVPTGDLLLLFAGGATLELIKLHSFLEAWAVVTPELHLLVDAWGEVNQWSNKQGNNNG